MWAHSKNVTCQISLSKRYVHGNCSALGAWTFKSARQLWDVGVKLLYTLHKLTYMDALGLLEHVCYVVPLLLSRIVRKHGRRWNITQSLNDLHKNPLAPFLEQPCRSV
jgi:hypothetical protein